MPDGGLRDLGQKVDAATWAIDAQRLEQEHLAKVTARKDRNLRIGIALACAIGLVGVAAGFKAQQAVDEVNASRAEARVTSCQAYNDDLVASVNALNDRNQDLLRTVVERGRDNRTPEQQASADALLQQELGEYESIKLEPRDCSPVGIAAFYEKRSRK